MLEFQKSTPKQSRKKLLALAIFTLILQCVVQNGRGQANDAAERIFQNASPSVVMIVSRSPDGTLASQGTGFMAGPNQIITNEHVIRNGNIFIDFGSFRIPAKVERVDDFNDLALLTTQAEIVGKPLRLSKVLPGLGTFVACISNPLGLQKTVSTGIISGLRKISERELLQTTVAISAGSSGGPILNINSEVVGIVVSVLEKGQNLNFAVPARFAQDLIEDRKQPNQGFGLILKWIEHTENTPDGKIVYSPKSEYQRALYAAGIDPEHLLVLSRKAKFPYPDIAIDAAERAIKVLPTEAAYNALGLALARMASNSVGQDSAQLRNRAAEAFRTSIRIAEPPLFETYIYLGSVLEGLQRSSEAYNVYKEAFERARVSRKTDDQIFVIKSLIETSFELKEFERANDWFKYQIDLGEVTEDDWQRQAERLENGLKDFKAAGEAYAKAASIKGGSWFHWCSAANAYIAADPALLDEAFRAAKACVENGRGKEGSQHDLSFAYRLIADILISRGLYEDGLKNADAAFALDGTNGLAQTSRGLALLGLSRVQEAVDAIKYSLKLTDGAFAWTHFALGRAHFELRQWDLARQSFAQAATLDPKSHDAAYNAALSCSNLEDTAGAVKWFEEVLRRSPNHPDRREIEQKIALFRRSAP